MSVPSFDHFEECANGIHPSDNVGFRGVIVRDHDARPRERQEIVERFEKYTPCAFIPVYKRLSIPTVGAEDCSFVPWNAVQLKVAHVGRVDLSTTCQLPVRTLTLNERRTDCKSQSHPRGSTRLKSVIMKPSVNVCSLISEILCAVKDEWVRE